MERKNVYKVSYKSTYANSIEHVVASNVDEAIQKAKAALAKSATITGIGFEIGFVIV